MSTDNATPTRAGLGMPSEQPTNLLLPPGPRQARLLVLSHPLPAAPPHANPIPLTDGDIACPLPLPSRSPVDACRHVGPRPLALRTADRAPTGHVGDGGLPDAYNTAPGGEGKATIARALGKAELLGCIQCGAEIVR